MGRILAIDFGQKRAGIAVTDENKIIATALQTVAVKDIFLFLHEYMKNETVDCIVVGEPRQMNNRSSGSVTFIDPFVRKLKKVFNQIPVERYDERFTSKIAERMIATSGRKRKDKQNKENIDKVSAVLILQGYMNFQQNKMNN